MLADRLLIWYPSTLTATSGRAMPFYQCQNNYFLRVSYVQLLIMLMIVAPFQKKEKVKAKAGQLLRFNIKVLL
jgi:hypothetical protein